MLLKWHKQKQDSSRKQMQETNECTHLKSVRISYACCSVGIAPADALLVSHAAEAANGAKQSCFNEGRQNLDLNVCISHDGTL